MADIISPSRLFHESIIDDFVSELQIAETEGPVPESPEARALDLRARIEARSDCFRSFEIEGAHTVRRSFPEVAMTVPDSLRLFQILKFAMIVSDFL